MLVLVLKSSRSKKVLRGLLLLELIRILSRRVAFSRYLILKAGKTLVVPSPALTAMPHVDSDADVFFYKVDGQALKVRQLSL